MAHIDRLAKIAIQNYSVQELETIASTIETKKCLALGGDHVYIFLPLKSFHVIAK